MTPYFSGRKLIKTFSIFSPNKRSRVDCEIFEEWRDIDEGTAARCGVEGTCTIEIASGITEKAMSTLKEVAGGTLGLKDVWSLKSEVESSFGREINWQVSQKSSKTFQIKPPPCGRSALTIYQLFRIYKITSLRKSWFSFDDEKWVTLHDRTIEERTNNHDAIPDTVAVDPVCNCSNQAEPQKYIGFLQISTATVGLRVPYWTFKDKLLVQIDRKVVGIRSQDLPTIMQKLDTGYDYFMNSTLIPEPLRFLGNIPEGQRLQFHMKLLENTTFTNSQADHVTSTNT